MRKIILSAACFAIFYPFCTYAVSFDCSKAKSFSEKAICSNQALSKSDDDLFILYKRARDINENSNDFKTISRSLWNMREKCTTEECVSDWYVQASGVYNSMLPQHISSSPKQEPDSTKQVTINNSDEEKKVIAIISAAQNSSESAKNDMVRGGIKANRDNELCKLIGSGGVHRWTGVVDNLSANSDGYGVLSVKIADNITLKTWNNSFSDTEDHTLINPSSDVFKSASNLSVGQQVVFSGKFLPDADGNCTHESSLGLTGGLSEPEFIFKFDKIEQKIEQPPSNIDANQVALAKQLYAVLVDSFTKACIFTGKGDDVSAVNAINDATYPGGGKNPVPITQDEFNGIKGFFLQYRTLDLEHCTQYAKELIAQSTAPK